MPGPLTTAIHLELRVQDIDRATQFYHQVFDSPPQGEPGTYSLFTVHGLELLLLVGGVYPVRFGLRLASLADLHALNQQLQARGLTPQSHQFNHPALNLMEHALNLTDPDGHRCSFYHLASV